MGKSNFGSIHNQTYLLKVFRLHFQPAACNWLVPISNIDHWIGQKPAQTLDRAEQLRFTGNFASNSAKANRSALMNADDQPGEVLEAGFSFHRLQLSNSQVPSMIESVDRHGLLLFLIWQKQVYIYRADQSFLLKVYSSKMLMRIQEILERDCCLDQSRPVLVGVSGGADSLCLMDSLHQLQFKIIVAHFDHGLRTSSQKEAALLARDIQKIGVPFFSTRANVRDFARENTQSIEEAARNLRYQFLFDVAEKQEAQAVFVGHNADDQVETVLLHLLQGSGLTGLRGMLVRSLPNPWSKRIPLMRPLLGFWRVEILSYLDQRGLQPFVDESNTDCQYLRNRIRQDLVPMLETLEPGVRQRIHRTAEILTGEDQMFEALTDRAWVECAFEIGEHGVSVNRPALLHQPLALRRRLIRRTLGTLRPVIVLSILISSKGWMHF